MHRLRHTALSWFKARWRQEQLFSCSIVQINSMPLLQTESEESKSIRSKVLEDLAVSLRTKTLRWPQNLCDPASLLTSFSPKSYVKEFIEQKGLTLLLDLLSSFNFEDRCVCHLAQCDDSWYILRIPINRRSTEHRNTLKCLQSLMNNSVSSFKIEPVSLSRTSMAPDAVSARSLFCRRSTVSSASCRIKTASRSWLGPFTLTILCRKPWYV